MRLLLATAVAVLKVITASADTDDNTIFKQHGSLQYVDNFLSPEESKHFYDTMESLSQAHPFDPTAKSRGNIMVSSLIQRRIKDVAGSECSINDDMIDTNGGGGIKLQTRIINKSTKPHIDYEQEGKVVKDDVMFITLNSNPEAHFNHGGNSLPAVAGRLVRFAGNAVHGTTLNSGDVRLLGPFSIKNFASVGDSDRGPDCPLGLQQSLCIEGDPSSNTISQPVEGSCNNGATECYELLNSTGDGACPSDTGVCIFEGDFVGNGVGSECAGNCYVCTNRAGTCPTSAPSTAPSSSPTSSPTFVCNGQCYKYDSVTRALTIDTSSNNVCESDTFCVETADVCPTDTPSSPTSAPSKAPSSSPSKAPTLAKSGKQVKGRIRG